MTLHALDPRMKEEKHDKYIAGTAAGVGLSIISAAYGIGFVAGHKLSGQFPADGYDTLNLVVGAIVLGGVLMNSNGGLRSAIRLLSKRPVLATCSFLIISLLTAGFIVLTHAG